MLATTNPLGLSITEEDIEFLGLDSENNELLGLAESAHAGGTGGGDINSYAFRRFKPVTEDLLKLTLNDPETQLPVEDPNAVAFTGIKAIRGVVIDVGFGLSAYDAEANKMYCSSFCTVLPSGDKYYSDYSIKEFVWRPDRNPNKIENSTPPVPGADWSTTPQRVIQTNQIMGRGPDKPAMSCLECVQQGLNGFIDGNNKSIHCTGNGRVVMVVYAVAFEKSSVQKDGKMSRPITILEWKNIEDLEIDGVKFFDRPVTVTVNISAGMCNVKPAEYDIKLVNPQSSPLTGLPADVCSLDELSKKFNTDKKRKRVFAGPDKRFRYLGVIEMFMGKPGASPTRELRGTQKTVPLWRLATEYDGQALTYLKDAWGVYETDIVNFKANKDGGSPAYYERTTALPPLTPDEEAANTAPRITAPRVTAQTHAQTTVNMLQTSQQPQEEDDMPLVKARKQKPEMLSELIQPPSPGDTY